MHQICCWEIRNIRQGSYASYTVLLHTHKKSGNLFIAGQSLFFFFSLDIKRRKEIEEACRQMLLNSMRGRGKKQMQSMDRKLCEGKGWHYVGCCKRKACREKDGKNLPGRATRRENIRGCSPKCHTSFCAKRPDAPQDTPTESGMSRMSIREEAGETKEQTGEKPLLPFF